MERGLKVLCLLLLAQVPTVLSAKPKVSIKGHWDGGFQAEVCIPITAGMTSWKAHLRFDEDVDSIRIWGADHTKISARDYLLENKNYQHTADEGDLACLTVIGSGTGDLAPETTVCVDGLNNCESTNGKSKKDYSRALGLAILFYDGQRSGKLPADNPISWRGDSALDDCVPGGWYDAGDHIKFGLPMSYATTMLSWSLLRFKEGFVQAGQLDMMYDMIKWPYEFFLAAWNSGKEELVVQVGDGDLDHDYWGRPEQMTMDRPCQSISPSNPGSDIAFQTASAFATGYLVFKEKGDTTYADNLLAKAKELYNFGKNHRGVFKGTKGLYDSSGDKDEMCEASMWMYRITKDSQYLDTAKSNVNLWSPWAWSWDDKSMACLIMLYEETQEDKYKNVLKEFFKDWMPGGSMPYTPCGMVWRDAWASNKYAGTAAFAALLAAEAGIEPDSYRKWAVEQINFLLGDNNNNGGCFSYEIGYGSNYPVQPHHRAASCPDMPAACGKAQEDVDAPSPQIHLGAVVGGPDQQGKYSDRRTEYVQNEVATDYSCGFTSALAAIVQLENSQGIPDTNNKCPCTN